MKAQVGPCHSSRSDTPSAGVRSGAIAGSRNRSAVYAEAAQSVAVFENSGEQSASLYDESALDKADKYTVFFGGNHPRVVIRSASASGGKLLYLKDSYANACAPYWTASFSEIHLIDLRYYKKSIADYIAENGIDQVLVSYSLANFVSDSNLLFAAR